jgi:hypothetical protein
LPSVQPFPDFIPPAPAFPSPQSLSALQSRKQASFHLPLIHFTPLQGYICLFPVRIIKIGGKNIQKVEKPKNKTKVSRPPRKPHLGKNARPRQVPRLMVFKVLVNVIAVFSRQPCILSRASPDWLSFLFLTFFLFFWKSYYIKTNQTTLFLIPVVNDSIGVHYKSIQNSSNHTKKTYSYLTI